MNDKTIVECMCAVMARRRVLPMIPLRNFTSLEEVADAFNSAARELDRLQADNARLRAACEGVPEMMQDMIGYLRSDTGWMHRSYDQYAEEIVTKVATLRAILDGAK